ncbi:SMP-30/gluconolactonase/LRE family protein [Streptomyces sp. NBC_00481]|uniref:hypothetical protein n=1 Tax=unclassified Streptomyces TaxID=2593676 RepID=UPI002DDABFBA|nr:MULTISPECIES: hypothetical protein [unclassified Streptomyces]WRZ01816.1 SMP-30/gluconolactonase/LRE family protein [Streptomyces sp. NBC_00481]
MQGIAMVLRPEPVGVRTLVTCRSDGHAVGLLGDVIVDSQGRVGLGNFGFDLYEGEPMKLAALHRVDPDGTITEVATDLWFLKATR